LGFREIDIPKPRNNYDVIAIFALNGEPTHIARMLSSGKWTSKLGDGEDIEHGALDSVGGIIYGEPVLYMRKKATP
jgi:hypothetical protein